eukprot:Seg2132.2 transcript_id=Seg2132.2/GoldUCD/mRNA.D3Y31 product="Platelet-activating factor acetylhydrolase IB subunit gamma" protein_id=Seg2132.2/GoldUCD/D3Y31
MKALNFGIGADRIENVLWRIQNGEIPSNVRSAVIQVGTNNIGEDGPHEIKNRIAKIAQEILHKEPDACVIITGLLPRDKRISSKRKEIQEVNKLLAELCENDGRPNLMFTKPEEDWTHADGLLNEKYYYFYLLHLNEEGNKKIAKLIMKHLQEFKRLTGPPNTGRDMHKSTSESFQTLSQGYPHKQTLTQAHPQHATTFFNPPLFTTPSTKPSPPNITITTKPSPHTTASTKPSSPKTASKILSPPKITPPKPHPPKTTSTKPHAAKIIPPKPHPPKTTSTKSSPPKTISTKPHAAKITPPKPHPPKTTSTKTPHSAPAKYKTTKTSPSRHN